MSFLRGIRISCLIRLLTRKRRRSRILQAFRQSSGTGRSIFLICSARRTPRRLTNDTLAEILHRPFWRGKGGMVVVVICRSGRGGWSQFHRFIENIRQVNCAGRQSVLAWATMRRVCGAGESISDRGGRAIEVVAGTGVEEGRRVWQTEAVTVRCFGRDVDSHRFSDGVIDVNRQAVTLVKRG